MGPGDKSVTLSARRLVRRSFSVGGSLGEGGCRILVLHLLPPNARDIILLCEVASPFATTCPA